MMFNGPVPFRKNKYHDKQGSKYLQHSGLQADVMSSRCWSAAYFLTVENKCAKQEIEIKIPMQGTSLCKRVKATDVAGKEANSLEMSFCEQPEFERQVDVHSSKRPYQSGETYYGAQPTSAVLTSTFFLVKLSGCNVLTRIPQLYDGYSPLPLCLLSSFDDQFSSFFKIAHLQGRRRQDSSPAAGNWTRKWRYRIVESAEGLMATGDNNTRRIGS